MRDSTVRITCTVLLALCMLGSSFWLGYSIQKSASAASEQAERNADNTRGALNEEEAAAYLGMPVEALRDLMDIEAKERASLGAYDTYKYLPFMEFRKVRYFSRQQLDLWLEYQMLNRTIRP